MKAKLKQGLKCAVLTLMLTSAPSAFAGTVTIITSFPKELTQAYKNAFEKANPDIKLEILNKNTVSGIAYVRETPEGQRPEVFWASSRAIKSPQAIPGLPPTRPISRAR